MDPLLTDQAQALVIRWCMIRPASALVGGRVAVGECVGAGALRSLLAELSDWYACCIVVVIHAQSIRQSGGRGNGWENELEWAV